MGELDHWQGRQWVTLNADGLDCRQSEDRWLERFRAPGATCEEVEALVESALQGSRKYSARMVRLLLEIVASGAGVPTMLRKVARDVLVE